MKFLILSIGRDIVSNAEKQMERQADAVIQVGELTPDEFPELRRQIYDYLKQWQDDRIELVLSGPVALALTLGQLIGLNHFDLHVFHYDSAQRTYQAVPMPTRNEVM